MTAAPPLAALPEWQRWRATLDMLVVAAMDARSNPADEDAVRLAEVAYDACVQAMGDLVERAARDGQAAARDVAA